MGIEKDKILWHNVCFHISYGLDLSQKTCRMLFDNIIDWVYMQINFQGMHASECAM